MKVILKDKRGVCHPVEEKLIVIQSNVIRECLEFSVPQSSEDILPLPSIEGEILAKIIAWVNRPQPESLDLDNSKGFFVRDLLQASDFLDMPVLSQQIISWLEKQLTSSNVLDWWIFSKGFPTIKLEVVCC